MRKIIILLISLLIMVGCSGGSKTPPHTAYICKENGNYHSFIFDKNGDMKMNDMPAQWKHEKGDYYSIYAMNGKLVGYLIANKKGIAMVNAVGVKAPVASCLVS